MKTIKQINEEMNDIMKRYPTSETTPREMLGHVAIEGNKLNVLKDQTESILKMIEGKIKYYTMPLKERLKLKLDFETGEAGHKVVILKILKSEIKG